MEHQPGPLVSIGVPVYNGERHLARALESVQAPDLDDRMAAIGRQFATAGRRVRFMRNSLNLGASPNSRLCRLPMKPGGTQHDVQI